MSNLIPTPRADKNGKVVTRHLKQSATSVSKALLSAVPMVGAKKLEKEQLSFGHVGRIEEAAIRNPLSRKVHKFNRDKSIRMMAQLIFGHGREVYSYTNEELFRKDIGYVLSAPEIEEALNLTMVLTRDAVPDVLADRDRVAIIEATLRPVSDKNCGRRISRLNDHIEWLKTHPGEAGEVVTVLDALGYENPEDDGFIGNLDALVAVADHDFLHDEEDYPQEMKRAYLLAASQSPQHADRISEYVLTRNGFDEVGFREYMNTAVPLAGGAL
jgi:hypothetical protein